MGLIERARTWLRGGRQARASETALMSAGADWMSLLFGGASSSTGIAITPDVAMENVGFAAGVRVIAEDLGSLPLMVYRRLQRGKERATDHHLYPLLHDAPNQETDAMAFVEMLTAWAASRGRGYAEIVRNGGGEAVALWQIKPEMVTMLRVSDDGGPAELVYRVALPPGQTKDGRSYYLLSRDRMFRLNGWSLDGVSGSSPIDRHAEAIGLTIALERHGARYFMNGSDPGAVLEHPGTMGDKAYERFREAWERRHKGIDNSHRLAILEEGMKVAKAGQQNDQAQFIENRKFQLRDMGRINRVKPHKIGDLEDATFSNIEHEAIDHVVSTVRPWAVRWERAIRLQLMPAADREEFFAEFLLDALLRGDMKSRYEAYAVGRNWGWLSADDVLERENCNPLPDDQGSVYLVPANMLPAAHYLKLQQQPPAPPKPEEQPRGLDPQALADAFLPLFAAAFRAIVRREAVALGKVAKAGKLADIEAGARAFLDGEAVGVRADLLPVVEAFVGLLGTGDAAGYAEAAAKRHVRLTWDEVGDCVRKAPATAGRALAELTEEWMKTRAAQLAEREVTHAVEALGGAHAGARAA